MEEARSKLGRAIAILGELQQQDTSKELFCKELVAARSMEATLARRTENREHLRSVAKKAVLLNRITEVTSPEASSAEPSMARTLGIKRESTAGKSRGMTRALTAGLAGVVAAIRTATPPPLRPNASPPPRRDGQPMDRDADEASCA